jgi:hypothetical protein
MRAYLNLEVSQLRTLLEIFSEIEFDRELTKSEKYLRQKIKSGLDKALTAC